MPTYTKQEEKAYFESELNLIENKLENLNNQEMKLIKRAQVLEKALGRGPAPCGRRQEG